MRRDRSRYIIKAEDFENVVLYFRNNHNNGSRTIAKKFNLHYNYVDYILDNYLSTKKNYYY
jgi:hypothetical protein